MDSAQPIIVKRIKKAAHGHHGGAWKVAFADFVTAMMAFFLLMWLMGSTSQAERDAIAHYFENPSAIQGPGGASTSMIELGTSTNNQNTDGSNDSQSSDNNGTNSKSKSASEEIEVVKDKQRLDSLKQDLEEAINASKALNPFKDQLLLDITAEGLRIQIIDKENRPMFDSGSSHLKIYTEAILLEFSKIINKVPNRISLTGHTDATVYSSTRGYTNWELSTDRANASRRALVKGGLDKSKVAKVVGLSSTVLFDKSNPKSPVNRRISMIVLNRQAEQALINDGNLDVSSSQGLGAAIMPSKTLSKPDLLGERKSPQPNGSKPLPLNSPSIKKKPVTLGKLPNKNSKPTKLPKSRKSSIEPIRLPISVK